MKILAADTSTKIVSIAVLNNADTKINIHKSFQRSQGSALIPMIKKLLDRVHWKIKDIELFCAGVGPGSFTGLRASLASMRMLAIALKRPIVGIPSFDAIAYGLGHRSDICVMFDARQGKVYSRFYRQDTNGPVATTGFLLDYINNILDKIEKQTIIAGDAVTIYKSEMLKYKKDFISLAPEKLWYPNAEVLGRIALDKFKKGYKDDPYKLLPLYIYPKECQIKK